MGFCPLCGAYPTRTTTSSGAYTGLKELYAHDFHATVVSLDIDSITAGLNEAAAKMVSWANKNKMKISAPKSILFTPWMKQVGLNLDVRVNNAETIDRQVGICVLNNAPPPVDKAEMSLPRLLRTSLSQLCYFV